jgi:branched-chain amino acid transport system ATP-binding protein
MTADLLDIRGLTVQFGGLVALKQLDLAVPEGMIFALVGPNGAGKTTALNCISGFVTPSAGSIRYRGREILDLSPDRRAALGIGRTFQNLQLFGTMTVLDNLLAAQHLWIHSNLFFDLLPFGPGKASERKARERAIETLDLMGLRSVADTPAGALPQGVQRLVGVARALVGRPACVLLDEPAAGMAESEVAGLAANLHHWRDVLGVTIVLIEHNMSLVQAVADRVCVLDYGRKLAEGDAATVLADPAVQVAYLGSDAIGAAASEGGK